MGLLDHCQFWRDFRGHGDQSLFAKKVVAASSAHYRNVFGRFLVSVACNARHSDGDGVCDLDWARCGRGGFDGYTILQGNGWLETDLFPLLNHWGSGRVEVVWIACFFSE